MRKQTKLIAIVSICCMIAFVTTNLRAEDTKETRTPGDFNAIELEGAYAVTLVKGSACSIQLEGEAADLQDVVTKVSGNDLEVKMKSHKNHTGKIKLVITYVELKEIEVSGTADIAANETIRSEQFEIELSGTANIDLSLDTQKLMLDLSGTGKITLAGKADKADVDISGAGKLYAAKLESKTYDIDISGVASAEINVSENLDADVSGMGKIQYSGNPQVHQSVSGSGKINKL